MQYYIIGAGFWGATIAERIATVMKQPVTVIDRRDHIGGNCHSSIDKETGIECHRYGSHIFHTSLPQVWEYITQFGEFTSYQHKVMLLRVVAQRVREAGYRVSNIDVTMIAQRPKLKDHIPQMAQNIAEDVGIAPDRVNVKATTEEKLGFTGTGEGMSCHAVCLLEE